MDQELLTYLDRRFGAIEQSFERIDQRFGLRFRQVDQRFERLEEEMRHLHILVEGLRGSTACGTQCKAPPKRPGRGNLWSGPSLSTRRWICQKASA